MPKRSGHFYIKERTTIAGEIFDRHKKKETSSPGSNAYEPTAWKHTSKVGKIYGTYRNVDEPPGYFEEQQNINNKSPLLKYNNVDLEKFQKPKPRYPYINKEIKRFDEKKFEKNLSPSPSTYETINAYEKSQLPKKKENEFPR